MLRAVALAATLTVGLAASALGVEQDRWERTDHSMSDALEANFEIVDSYFDTRGQLVFVLQRGKTALLCAFEALVFVQCLELNGDN